MAGEGEYGYRQRVAAWCKHHAKTEGRLFMCIGAVQLLEPGDLEAFLQKIKAIKPIIVVIDTMARSMVGSDENSTRDMGLFIQALGTVRQALDCAVLVIHHTNKEGVFERGSSALRGASDSMIKVSAEDDLIRIECSKTKDAQPFPTRHAQIVPVEVQINDQVIDSAVIIPAEKVAQTPDDPLTNAQIDVLRILNDEPFGAERKEIADLTNIPYHSLQRVLSRLKQLGYIQQPARNEPYQITDAGKERLKQIDDRYDRIDQPFFNAIKESNDHPCDQGDQPDHIDHPDHFPARLPLDAEERKTDSAAYYRAGL
jgi:DNA-binding MarR family transcriptional regulator